ncbi:MAG: galactonate dehydratase [Subdoligranulum variabile]|uniref:galactonate dehydratase n=1 Tax=Gemmiger sp. TaxID=2049027 RepID=UPI002A913D2E|nr:galactonate dehydratase [Gemmiger sp.]MDD7640232.1 galactonate dehydratase [Subdoligranulum variabile]MDY5605155.1 galactonate dehydratase [Gemmiger sp.]
MKITKLETFRLQPRWLLLRVETDDGYVGWGEPVVEGRVAATQACVHELEPYLIGQDPRRIEHIWQTLYRGGFYRGGPVLTSALSGIDQALWDIKGKALGVPVYDLLGGAVRDKMAVYSWIDSDTPEIAARSVKEKMAQGFTTVKMFGTCATGWIDDRKAINDLLERVQAVRDAAGPDVGIAIDFHGRAHHSMARTLLKELEPLKPLFVEEPVLVENLDAFADLHRRSNIPLATGERSFTRWGFKELLERGCADIIQPDLSHAGGISEVRRIAAMAETYDVALAPHCPLGPVALAACLQVDFASINACLQEQSIGMAYNKGQEIDSYLRDPAVFAYQNGYVPLLTSPGLGVDVDEEIVRRSQVPDLAWKNPVFYMEDGSVTEW